MLNKGDCLILHISIYQNTLSLLTDGYLKNPSAYFNIGQILNECPFYTFMHSRYWVVDSMSTFCRRLWFQWYQHCKMGGSFTANHA